MNMNRRLAVLASLLAVVTLTTPAVGSGPAPSPQQAHFEIRFMEQMIDHHSMAVMMAQMCLSKAVHPELRSMCENIITSQSQEIQMMQAWLQQWYSISYVPKMNHGQMNKLMRLEGAEFEIEFMEEMIRHHEAAIRESTDCLMRAFHQELRNLCQSIIQAQSAEINQMRTWLCQWYGECEMV